MFFGGKKEKITLLAIKKLRWKTQNTTNATVYRDFAFRIPQKIRNNVEVKMYRK